MTQTIYPERHDYSLRGTPQSFMGRMSRIPNLTAEEEVAMITLWQTKKDQRALDAVLASYQKFIVSIAMQGIGKSQFFDAVQAGNLGLIRSLERYEPERGFRLATFAHHWIRASIDEMLQPHMVKLNTSAERKKILQNLTKAVQRYTGGAREPTLADFEKAAEILNVDTDEIVKLYPMISQGDFALDAPMKEESDTTHLEFLRDTADSPEDILGAQQEVERARGHLRAALTILQGREKDVFIARRMTEPPRTLEDLAGVFNISRERVRQIEVRAFDKVAAEARRLAAPPDAVLDQRYDRFMKALLQPVALDL